MRITESIRAQLKPHREPPQSPLFYNQYSQLIYYQGFSMRPLLA